MRKHRGGLLVNPSTNPTWPCNFASRKMTKMNKNSTVIVYIVAQVVIPKLLLRQSVCSTEILKLTKLKQNLPTANKKMVHSTTTANRWPKLHQIHFLIGRLFCFKMLMAVWSSLEPCLYRINKIGFHWNLCYCFSIKSDTKQDCKHYRQPLRRTEIELVWCRPIKRERMLSSLFAMYRKLYKIWKQLSSHTDNIMSWSWRVVTEVPSSSASKTGLNRIRIISMVNKLTTSIF